MALYEEGSSPFENLEILGNNPYPGRLLVVGYAGEAAVQAYAVMGRSDGSRNRVLVESEPGVVSTEVFDESMGVGDPALTIYDAMRATGDLHVVSNGNQTATAIRVFEAGMTFAAAMKETIYEPDDPNFTSRITGFHRLHPAAGEAHAGISVIRRSSDGRPHRRLYTDLNEGTDFGDGSESFGLTVHTYTGATREADGSLIAMNEKPFRLPVFADPESMTELLWSTLDENNRVAVAAKVIQPDGSVAVHIINRHQQQ